MAVEISVRQDKQKKVIVRYRQINFLGPRDSGASLAGHCHIPFCKRTYKVVLRHKNVIRDSLAGA